MGRNRVSSFLSQLSAGRKTPTPPPSSSPTSDESPYFKPKRSSKSTTQSFPSYQPEPRRPVTPPSNSDYGSPVNSPHHQRPRSTSRPLSIVQAYQPPVMDVTDATIPELQPVFTFLNTHSNKLYHEGYFLKLDDQNTQGRPNPDRSWNECFAQLVGTILSLWDAAELDVVGDNGEVLPKFINLTDASIRMIESLPTRSTDQQPLQNILSVSTAGRNRYLLHFNSHDSLVEWTAAIRLAMYEYSVLQEAYTGALIAGKGKSLNNISIILERSRFKTEDWVRVRFGAGVPWRRCWCVIAPPDEKEYAKLQKELKKRSPYDRSPIPVIKGDIKFYDARTEGKKQKKVQPIASINDAYSAYAIYPQARSLVDASTLIKIEGNIVIHTRPSSSSEGFVFMMPETRPAVSGFETMLRFLFPMWDTFGLYGRPGRLIASVLDSRSLMFAMPKSRRDCYLDVDDVTGLLLNQKTASWNEKEWRKRLKDATGTRMNSVDDSNGAAHSRSASRISARISFSALNGPAKSRVGFAGDNDGLQPHHRSPSGSNSPDGFSSNSTQSNQSSHLGVVQENMAAGDGLSSDEERATSPAPPMAPVESMRASHTPEPVVMPPAFSHTSLDRPSSKPYHSPKLRQANARLSCGTLDQMAKAGGISLPNDANGQDAHARDAVDGVRNEIPSVPLISNPTAGMNLDESRSREALSPPNQDRPEADRPRYNHSNQRPRSAFGLGGLGDLGASHSQGSNGGRPLSSDGRPLPYPPGSNSRPPQNGVASPRHDQQAPSRPSGPRPYPGSGAAYAHHRKSVPIMSTIAAKHQSLTPNDIIDHYTTQARDHYDRTSSLLPPLLPHEPLGDIEVPSYDDPEYWRKSIERPRAGVLKTVGDAEPRPKSQYDIPDFTFGPTINYGATAVLLKKFGSGDEQKQRPRTPEQPQPGHRRQVSATMAWRPALPPPVGQTSPQALTPEQYVEHRAAAAASPYGHARKHSANTLGGRSPSPSMSPARSISSQSLYQALGLAEGAAPSGQSIFGQPLRSGAESPPRGQHPGQAF